MKSFLFTKMSGAGNDFILFDRQKNPDLEISDDFIKKVCDRRKGIGSDGVLIIQDSNECSFDALYYNADGSTGSLCANGARCAIKYAFVSGRIDKDLISFSVNGSRYSGSVLDGKEVKFFLNPPERIKCNFKIKAAGQLINSSFADTGSPHVVINAKDVLRDSKNPCSFFKNIEELPVFELGEEIRYSPDFAPDGVNVNFIEIENEVIKIRTYERGVENETLACGTGSVAAAIITFMNNQLKPPITLIPKSGDILIVDFNLIENKIGNLSLTGPAEITFNGELSI